MRVALYTATIMDATGVKVDEELRWLHELAINLGWEVAGAYADVGMNMISRRPQLQRLCRDAHGESFQAVLVVDFNRLGRQRPELLQLHGALSARGIGIWDTWGQHLLPACWSGAEDRAALGPASERRSPHM